MELCALGLLLIPSVTLTASFAPKERVLHSWGTFSPFFVSRGCCLALMGDSISLFVPVECWAVFWVTLVQ